jgi:transcriptional regulator with XRE-family HTH domain
VTLGDHKRKRRLDLGLLQREVAERLSADTCSVTNWELNRTKPALWFLPAIVRFLGYVPWSADGSIGHRLLAYRRERGLPNRHWRGCSEWTLERWVGGNVGSGFLQASTRGGPRPSWKASTCGP